MQYKTSLAVLVLAAFALSASASERITYKAAKSSSSYYQMAVQLGESVTQATNQALSLTIEESQGSVQNVKEARKRQGNYIFTTPPGLIGLAQNGKAMFEKDNPKDYATVRALFPIPFLTMHFVASKESGIKTFEDLNWQIPAYGKRELWRQRS